MNRGRVMSTISGLVFIVSHIVDRLVNKDCDVTYLRTLIAVELLTSYII